MERSNPSHSVIFELLRLLRFARNDRSILEIVIAFVMKWSEAIPALAIEITTPDENNRDIADTLVLHDYSRESPILNYVIYKFP